MDTPPPLWQQGQHYLGQLTAGQGEGLPPLPTALAQSPEERQFVEAFNQFLTCYQAGLQFVRQVSEGQLDAAPPVGNQVIGPFKQLHAELKHLVWQTQRLAAGDLNQQVNFMGSLSTAFNTLIEALRERQDLHARLQRSEEFYKTLLRLSPDGITVVDMAGAQQFISDKGLAMFGYTFAELQGRNFIEIIVPEERERVLALVQLMLNGQYTGLAEYHVAHKNGETFWIEANAEVIRDRNGEPEAMMFIYRDTTKRKALEQQLYDYSRQMAQQARTDRMTGLLNRAEGLDMLSAALAHSERRRASLAIGFVDMDDLKYINDHYGHAEGDRMILALTDCIQQAIRASDHVARMGGDEFLIIFPDCEAAQAQRVIDRLTARVEGLGPTEGLETPLAISHGIAVSDLETRLPAEQLIKLADERMYLQKREKKARAGR